MNIPFNKPFLTGREIQYINEAHLSGKLSGNGAFTERCETWLENKMGCQKALLTHSCTAALEMAAILLDIKSGDEIIMPAYTFVSTANAFALRGGIPVFVDIRPDTLNIDETKIEAAITPKTRAIVPVHYAGVGCDMDVIMAIAKKHQLFVIEDAAHGIMSTYKNRMLGSIGHMGTYSFHETKNIMSGEGGALLVNDSQFLERAEILREKGTNRTQFFRGETNKYTWMDVGSSFLPSELTAAFLWAQMEEAENITDHRLSLWNVYHAAFKDLAEKNNFRRPIVPLECQHNAHMYYLLLPTLAKRTEFMMHLKNQGINTVFHYVPLHQSPAGRLYSRTDNELTITMDLADRIVRLPLWLGMEELMEYIVRQVVSGFILASTPHVSERAGMTPQ
ncbi:MAG TPA: dTDP-4-amino-4,6-dideoxygalactose transaminase [Gammaproteobacteria bacterium]|nr:dTDP-4-amino-4,6-dideoxygalactose transaminase [Gammaproteobacteria bacterium]